MGLRIEDHAIPVGRRTSRAAPYPRLGLCPPSRVPRLNRRALSQGVAPLRLPAVRDAPDAGARLRRERAAPAELAQLWRPAEPDREGAARERACSPGAAAEV